MLSYAFICNTSTDCISKVNIETYQEEKKYTLNHHNNNRIGPHGICRYNGNLLVANSYSHSLIMIDLQQEEILEEHFIGMSCKDVAVYKDQAYVICGDANVMVVFDLQKKRVVEQIPCGDLPHSIHIFPQNKMALVANMMSDSISLIDCGTDERYEMIKVGPMPTKALFSADGERIFVCESNLGQSSRGCISMISRGNRKLLHRVAVGNSPVDMFCSTDYCFVSNFGDGTVSIIDINRFVELDRINIGGMPRGIMFHNNFLYIGDYYNNLLIRLDIVTKEKKIIPIGKEPTGMTIL